MKFSLIIYAVCWLFRLVDYFLIRSDQSLIGEAFTHKLLGIALFALSLRALRWTWSDTGFPRKRALGYSGLGLLLGLGVFSLAYTFEYLFLSAQGQAPRFALYLSGYGVQGNRAMGAGLGFLGICIVGNIINAVMEEGVFRGLFVRLVSRRHSWFLAALFCALLFGFWHIAQPLRSMVDGEISFSSFAVQALGYTAITLVVGFKYSLLARVSGSLWLPMGEHFVNNTLINILHVTSEGGSDLQMPLRVAIAQGLALVISIVLFMLYNYRKGSGRERSA